MSMSQDALASLAAMPDQLERLYRSVPAGFARWEPPSWEGFPGETFAALGQLCHVRDIEILCSHDQQHLACLHWLIGKIASLRRQA